MKFRILVVDDEPLIRRMTTLLLEHLGYDVCCAEDALEAVWVYDNAYRTGYVFSAVLMDLTIPNGGGVAATDQIRKINADALVIVSTGYACDPAVEDFKRFGFSEVLVKPYGIQDLGAVLSRVCT